MKAIIIVFAFLAILPSCKKKGKNNPNACNGNTRREVKIMTDNSASLINFNPQVISLEALGDLSVPEVKNNTPRQSIELNTYTVRAKVDKVKRERDGDYHLRLQQGDFYLITECPNPGCTYAQYSPYLSTYITVRNFIESNDLENKEVEITGVAFIDIDHHYKRKQAKNNIELHPILSISY